MEFTQPEDFKSKKIEIKPKLKAKLQSLARTTLAAGAISASAVGLGYIAKEKYYTDYSDMPTETEAVKKAQNEEKTGFMYKGKYYDTEKWAKKLNIKP
jgi:hypothetical protein